MPTLRLATFNLENLMMRFDFSNLGPGDWAKRLTQVSDAERAETIDNAFNVLGNADRDITAMALADCKAEVVCLQEVENFVALTSFHNRVLWRFTRQRYDHKVLIEGNDARGIDVAVMSRAPLRDVRSHAALTYAQAGLEPPRRVGSHDRVFRRDCLEVDVEKDGRCLTLFVCHFKSMHGGRSETRSVRMAEARAVRGLIEARFDDPAAADWVVLGDFNDFLELDGVPVDDHGLAPLVEDDFAVDLAIARIRDPLDRWTHHYAPDDTYAALDHIFLSPALAEKNPNANLRLVRAGQPGRAERYAGTRYPGVGWRNPKASDHCPVVAELCFDGTPAAPV